MVYRMKYEELNDWVKNKAQPGDIAYYFDRRTEQNYLYSYKGPDDNPYWRLVFNEVINKYLVEEIDKLKIDNITVSKRCENCKYWAKVAGVQPYCTHDKHVGMYVPGFTSCPEHEPKEERSTPFDNLKFYLKDTSTGELDIKYICEDCGKIEDKPFHWWAVLSVHRSGKASKRPGYHFRCEECDKKKDGKI